MPQQTLADVKPKFLDKYLALGHLRLKAVEKFKTFNQKMVSLGIHKFVIIFIWAPVPNSSRIWNGDARLSKLGEHIKIAADELFLILNSSTLIRM